MDFTFHGEGIESPYSPPPEYASEYILLLPVISFFYSISKLQVLLKLSNIQPSKESSLSYPVSDLLLLFVPSSIRPFFYSLSYTYLKFFLVLFNIRPTITPCPIQYPTYCSFLSYPVSYLPFFLDLSSFRPTVLPFHIQFSTVFLCPFLNPTYCSS